MDRSLALTVFASLPDSAYCWRTWHFHHAVARWEYGFGLRYFAQLAVKPLDGVGGIDGPVYLLLPGDARI